MHTLMRTYGRLVHLAEQPWAVGVIILANLIGFVWGTIYWYGGQLLQSPLYLWPFIPDCPLFALLFVPAFILTLRGRGNNAYNLLVAFGLIKYGVWTNLAWYGYWALGYPLSGMGVAMCLTHIGMILEGLYLLYALRPRITWALVAGAWFISSDYVDYGLGYFPAIPDLRVLPLLKWHTIGMTFLLTGGFMAWAVRIRRKRASTAMWEPGKV